MRGFLCSRGSSERAAALVEFAISLPALLIILFAILDFGKLIRESNVIVQSTHRGARSGAALAQPEKSFWCSQQVPLTFTHNCGDVQEWPIEFDALGDARLRALEGGLRLSCSYLKHAGLKPRDWSIKVSGPLLSSAEGDASLQVQQRGIKVSVSQTQKKSRCFTCFLGLFSGFFMAEESSFNFQFTC